IGGDDFAAVVPTLVNGKILDHLCERFDEEKMQLFNAEHRREGYYMAHDRTGSEEAVPLVTMSLAVVTSENLTTLLHREEISHITAELKKNIKAINRENGFSGYLVDRRQHHSLA
ncbi:MAG: GGDEF domain-containing protein, partial [Candidatus Sumerlaeota bacterium]